MPSNQRKHQLATAVDSYAALPERRSLRDPFCGVVSEKRYLYSGDDTGKKFGRPRSWEWNPTERDPPMHIHGDGWCSGHGGTVEDSVEDPITRLRRAAGLTEEELAVRRAQLGDLEDEHAGPTSGRSYGDVAAKVGLSVWQVHRRVKSANRKIAAYRAATAPLRCAPVIPLRPLVRSEVVLLPISAEDVDPPAELLELPRQASTLLM